MNRRSRHLSLITALGTSALLAGCATPPPKPLRGEFSIVVPEQAAGSGQIGDSIRWGGRIIAVTPSPQETCFEILGRELAGNARPVTNADQGQGRFIACRAGFYDPAIFTTERDVTITGQIRSYETRRIGEYDYRYPHVAAEVIYLWPQQQPRQRVVYPDPFWPGPYGAFGWGYPYRTVIVPHAPHQETPTPTSE